MNILSTIRRVSTVNAYRNSNPRSRAQSLCTTAGSNPRMRVATCTFCRAKIAVCSVQEVPSAEYLAAFRAGHGCDLHVAYTIVAQARPINRARMAYAAAIGSVSLAMTIPAIAAIIAIVC